MDLDLSADTDLIVRGLLCHLDYHNTVFRLNASYLLNGSDHTTPDWRNLKTQLYFYG